MNKQTVFLLQDTKELNDELSIKFNSEENFEVVGCATDGISAISIIAEKKPDFLITGLILAGYDGMSVISRVREIGLTTKIIVISSMTSDEVVSKAISTGAQYFMAKPCNFSVLIECMKGFVNGKDAVKQTNANYFHKISLEEKISKIFINVGIPAHIKGYNFLREGVKMAVEDPEIINNITKRLYPSIGEKYNTTASKVERAIRHAIEVAWNRGRIESFNALFGVRAYSDNEKPTNSEFIALIADRLLLDGIS